MAKTKLTKGEIAGIRLIADVFVVNDLKKNVLAKSKAAPHLKELEASLAKACPILNVAADELQKQIQAVRAQWLRELEDEHGE